MAPDSLRRRGPSADSLPPRPSTGAAIRQLLSLATLSAVVASGSTGLAAQDRAPLDLRTPARTVAAEEIATLDFRNLPHSPDIIARVFALPGGGWGVSSATFAGTVQLFDPAGAPAGTLGRGGEGPGEFSEHFLFGVPTTDGLWVVDPGNARATRFSSVSSGSGGLELEDSRPLPGRTFFAAPPLEGGGVLLTGFYDGRAVARLSLDAEEDAFGGRIPDVQSMNGRIQAQNAAAVPGGEVWSIAVQGGAIDILGPDLSVVEARSIPHEELRRTDRPGPPSVPREPMAPQLGGPGVGPDGTLWITFGVADAEWDPEWTRADGFHARNDTRVLAIDPATRAVVGELRLDELCLPAGGARLSCVDELGLGVRVLELRIR